MKARKLVSRSFDAFGGTVHLSIVELPEPIPGLDHCYKYRIAFTVGEEVRVLYDVHTGKTDHKHILGREFEYRFTDIETLLEDFFQDVEEVS